MREDASWTWIEVQDKRSVLSRRKALGCRERIGKGSFSFRRTSSRRWMKKPPHTEVEVVALLPNNAIDVQSPNNTFAVNNTISAMVAVGTSIKPKKKAGGVKLRMRFDKFGQSKLIECDKSTIIKHASISLKLNGSAISGDPASTKLDSSGELLREKSWHVVFAHAPPRERESAMNSEMVGECLRACKGQ